MHMNIAVFIFFYILTRERIADQIFGKSEWSFFAIAFAFFFSVILASFISTFSLNSSLLRRRT